MLHYETIDPNLLELLKDLMSQDYLRQFVLVGGTALALQIGHRKSIDLDLFTDQDFSSNNLVDALLEKYDLQLIAQTEQSLIGTINKIKVDFIRFKYPFIHPIIEKNGLRMLAVEDIAPMKLDAIAGRGSKKDFYDLYYLLQKFNLETLFNLYVEKYPHQTTFHVARSMVYFADAEHDPDPFVFKKDLTWSDVKSFIIKEIQKL